MNWMLSQVWTIFRSAWRRLRRSSSLPGVDGEDKRERDQFDRGELKAGPREKAESEVGRRAEAKPADEDKEGRSSFGAVEVDCAQEDVLQTGQISGEQAEIGGDLAGGSEEVEGTKSSEVEQETENGQQAQEVPGMTESVDEVGPSREHEHQKQRGGTRVRGKPVARGGERGRGKKRKDTRPEDEGKAQVAARRVPLTRIICRKRAGRWEIAIVPGPGVFIRGAVNGNSDKVNGEFCPAVFRSVVSVGDSAGGREQRVAMFADEAMVFRLGTDWQGEGRKVRGVGTGHFIVIAPATWTRVGDAPVEPEICVDGSFRAHYFFRDRGDPGTVKGFAEGGVTTSVIELVGERVFDASDQGELFFRKPPVLKAPGMVWARVGEEGKQGWGETYRLDGRRSLADVLNGRQGWFFARVYREGESVEVDSVQFRYIANLREIRLDGETYTADTVLLPTARGHAAVDIEIESSGECGVTAIDSTDGTRQVDSQAGRFVCEPRAEVQQLRCRLEGVGGGVDVVVALPRIWWCLATPGEIPQSWRDTAKAMTRIEFRRLAFVGTEVWIDMPERVSRVGVGFTVEGGVNYRGKKNGQRVRCAIPLAHYLDHAEIDRRLFRDATLKAHIAGAAVDLIAVAEDPRPRIVEFSAEPVSLSPGDKAMVQWVVENSEGITLSLSPRIGVVEAEGSHEIRVDRTTVVTLTLSASGMEDLVEERVIEVMKPEAMSVTHPVACAKAVTGWRIAKGFSVGELAAVPETSGEPIRTDRRRRSVHAVNVASLERWMNEQG